LSGGLAVAVVVDERERNSGVPGFLMGRGVRVDFSTLEVGDYIVSPDVAVERKTVHDLVMSIYDGRIFEQAQRLSASFSRPVLIVEGDLYEIHQVARNPNSVLGALASLAVNERLAVLPSPSPEDTASLIYFMAKQAVQPREGLPLLPRVRKNQDLAHLQLAIVGALPGVGPKLALRLLQHFKTPRGVVLASRAEMARVEGVGWARAGRIEAALTTPFRPPPRRAG
jgi:DNA excision repair protein ERCC-4